MDNHFNFYIISFFMFLLSSCQDGITKKDILSPYMDYSYHIQYKKDTIFVSYQEEDGSSEGFVPGYMVREFDEYYSYDEDGGFKHKQLALTLRDTSYYHNYRGNEYFVRFEKDPVDELYWKSNYLVINRERKQLLSVFVYDKEFHIVRIIRPQIIIYQPKEENEQFDYKNLHGIGKDESNRCE